MSKKKKGKKKKKKDKSGENKPKKPTEKEIFSNEIKNLQLELNFVDSKLELQQTALQALKELFTREKESKRACVDFLKRTLKANTDECFEVHCELQKMKNLEELIENRACDMQKSIERSKEISKSLFFQQKSELMGILSLYEEKRLKKNKQLPYLKKLDEELKEKLSIKQSEDREEEKTRLGYLLQKKKKFEHLVDDLCSKSEEVFQLSLPVYAKKQFQDNVLLRSLCDIISENVLAAQDQNRLLTKKEESLKIETEALNCTEDYTKSVANTLKGNLESLLEDEDVLLDGNRMEVDKYDIKEKESDLRNIKEELFHVEDEIIETLAILADQEDFKKVLEQKLAERINLNGQMISSIVRAGKIVRSRIEEDGRENELDYEFLQQIRMLFEDYFTENKTKIALH